MLVIVGMSIRNIRKLPLLEAFHAIMTRGSLVAAAESMNVTQSAVSKQLAHLRDWLDDELFVRTSDGMQPTPRALELRERVEAILSEAAELAAEGPTPPSRFWVRTKGPAWPAGKGAAPWQRKSLSVTSRM